MHRHENVSARRLMGGCSGVGVGTRGDKRIHGSHKYGACDPKFSHSVATQKSILSKCPAGPLCHAYPRTQDSRPLHL